MAKLGYNFPELYKKHFAKELWNSEIRETKATCENCNWKEYNPRLKCCTYEPFLPNYLVGAILSSEATAPSARASILKKIENREYALPIGLVASPGFQVRFNHREENEFGQREDWLCPYYSRDSQNCGIWKHRGAVCTTFYCQSSYGVMGSEFWKQMSDYLTYFEMALMEEALIQLDFSPRQMNEGLGYLNRREATPAELKAKNLSEAKAKKIWNGYFDDPVGFYKKCFRIVSEMSPSQVREALGELGEQIEENVLESLREALLSPRED